MASRRTELPTAVTERARRHRARLDSRGVRLEGPARGEPDLDSIDESTSSVLLVAALPDDERRLRRVLEDLRGRLGPGTSVRVVQPTRPFFRSRAAQLARRVRRGPLTSGERPDVAAAVRAAGFTVASIERFAADEEQREDLWVDLVALDLGSEPPTVRSGEGDGDQRGE